MPHTSAVDCTPHYLNKKKKKSILKGKVMDHTIEEVGRHPYYKIP